MGMLIYINKSCVFFQDVGIISDDMEAIGIIFQMLGELQLQQMLLSMTREYGHDFNFVKLNAKSCYRTYLSMFS